VQSDTLKVAGQTAHLALLRQSLLALCQLRRRGRNAGLSGIRGPLQLRPLRLQPPQGLPARAAAAAAGAAAAAAIAWRWRCRGVCQPAGMKFVTVSMCRGQPCGSLGAKRCLCTSFLTRCTSSSLQPTMSAALAQPLLATRRTGGPRT